MYIHTCYIYIHTYIYIYVVSYSMLDRTCQNMIPAEPAPLFIWDPHAPLGPVVDSMPWRPGAYGQR